MKYLYAGITVVVQLAFLGHYGALWSSGEVALATVLLFVVPALILRYGPKP